MKKLTRQIPGSRQVGYQKVSKLKDVLDDMRDNLIRNVFSKMEENNGEVVEAASQTCDKNLRTIFARGFPPGTKFKQVEHLKAFENAIRVSLPWDRETKECRGYCFVEFSREQDCLDALLVAKNLVFQGVKIQTRQCKPCNKKNNK